MAVRRLAGWYGALPRTGHCPPASPRNPGYEPEDREDESPDALARLVSTTEGAALHRCLKELEEERRRLVVMAFVDGLSHSELAVQLSCRWAR